MPRSFAEHIAKAAWIAQYFSRDLVRASDRTAVAAAQAAQRRGHSWRHHRCFIDGNWVALILTCLHEIGACVAPPESLMEQTHLVRAATRC
jgi:hypothetical protein